eukprot:TRINITY_DN546_c0_g1_i2.p2 TRINITY_DN546_c0_g1~~TRINITY_DN546_c0_g1_i2.p2  ORF type:complete len:210 (-),score=18.25 TRINITY_DN546_c0_g1_i2:1005-1634(-)
MRSFSWRGAIKFKQVRTLKINEYRKSNVIADFAVRGITLSEGLASQALKQARTSVFGDVSESFSLLNSFGASLRAASPGTIFDVRVNDDDRFTSVFCFPDACRRALPHIHPLLCVDATFLKGPVAGTLFSTVGVDSEGGVFPLCFTLFSNNENKESWELHLRSTVEASGWTFAGWTVITDRPRGIDDVFESAIPDAHHAYCMRHVSESV